MLLEIDTAGQEAKIHLLDSNNQIILSNTWHVIHNHTEEILSNIELILKEAGKKYSDLSSIKVNPGPGPYTGVRVGVTVANTLAFSLDIPVITEGLDTDLTVFGTPVLPVYAFAPKISQSKS